MWEWSLNWNEMRDDLLIGSCPISTDDLSRIKNESGASAVLSLQTDECRAAFGIDIDLLRAHAQEIHLTMANAPMRDFDPPDQRRNLPNAVRQLTRLLGDGHRVYLHCTAGINRAPLTALGYLTFVERHTPEEAMRLIGAARHDAEPSWEAYEGCRRDLLDALNRHVHVCAYYLSQMRPDAQTEDHWFEAEAHTLVGVFTHPGIYPTARLDPSRD